MPSVRGRERVVVASLLTSSSALSGALAGFVAGVVGEWVDLADGVPSGAVVAALVATVVLDRFVPPLSVRKQVPQLWGRIFSVRTTAVLYGARLGVGPLTILRTWWWWLAALAGALAGVWVSVAVGAFFGSARIVVMLAAGTRAGALRRRERFAMWSGPVAAAALAAIAFAAAPTPDDSSRGAGAGPAGARDAYRQPEEPAASSSAPTTSTPTTTIAADASLAALLPNDIGADYERVPDDGSRALGPLDLRTAAAIEQDEQAERSLLETRRFEIGHARAWRADDGRTAYLAAYRFGSASDAAAYLVDGFITLEGRGARVYDVPEVGGRGFSQVATSAETGDVAHGVAFTRGDVFFLAVVSSTSSAATPSDALHLAEQVAQAPPSSG